MDHNDCYNSLLQVLCQWWAHKGIEIQKGFKTGDTLSSLLFVLVMKYILRILQKLKETLDFNYHSKCETLKIINLIFADDLLLFARGDTRSIELLMSACNSFSLSTGLNVNPDQCRVYFGNVDDHIKQDIQNLTHFTEGPLPSNILAFPLQERSSLSTIAWSWLRK